MDLPCQKRVLQLLNSRSPCHPTVTGVGGEITATYSSTTTLSLKFKLDTSSSIAFSRPASRTAVSFVKYPDFANPGDVDCIQEGELYPTLILEGLRKGAANLPVVQRIRLGWILTGSSTDDSTASDQTLEYFITSTSTSEQLRRFWVIEEVVIDIPFTPEEKECERHFQSTHSRDNNGPFVKNRTMCTLCTLPYKECAEERSEHTAGNYTYPVYQADLTEIKKQWKLNSATKS